MNNCFKLLVCLCVLAPLFALSQINPPAKDTTHPLAPVDSTTMAQQDSVRISDSLAAVKKQAEAAAVHKDCYTEWLDAFRTRGAKPVTDGMQKVVIALKDSASCRCFMGQVEVAGGKIKPPLYFQQENGEYRLVSVVGKKLEPAFASTLTPDELYVVKDGMSIVFRTADQEYGRIFFYTFVNRAAESNKEAMSPSALIKD